MGPSVHAIDVGLHCTSIPSGRKGAPYISVVKWIPSDPISPVRLVRGGGILLLEWDLGMGSPFYCDTVTGNLASQEIWHPHAIFPKKLAPLQENGNLRMFGIPWQKSNHTTLQLVTFSHVSDILYNFHWFKLFPLLQM